MEETIAADDLTIETFDLSEHLVSDDNLLISWCLITILSSAEKVANNDNLLSTILLRVPAKSLVRFKCISKHWLSLISDTNFCDDHTRRNSNLSISGIYIYSGPFLNLKTELRDDQPSLPKLDFLTTPSGDGAQIIDSCNGLILCTRGREFIVCNLTTQKFKVISPPSRPLHNAQKFLYFDPMKSPHYKLVIIHKGCTTSLDPVGDILVLYSCCIDIYSSESGIWKKTRSSKQLDHFSDKVLCDGAIYWIAGPITLMRFDINAENLTTIQMPPDFVRAGNKTISWLGEYAGNLILVVEATGNLQIVEMDMHHSRCTIKYIIDRGLTKHNNVFFLMGENKKTLRLLFAVHGRIISYNLKSYYNKMIQDFPCDVRGIIKLSPGLLRVHKFIASLAVI